MTKNQSRWVRLMPADKQSAEVTHYPPENTLCERTVAAVVREAWRVQAAQTPGLVLAKTKVVSAKAGWLDMGGMARLDRKIYELPLIDELLITVPARDVEDYIEAVAWKLAQPAEEFGGKRYRTLHAMRLGLLLTEEQCTAILGHLRAILPEAQAIATIENDQFNREIADANLPNVIAPRRPVGRMERA